MMKLKTQTLSKILGDRKIDKWTIVFKEKKLLGLCESVQHQGYDKILYVESDGA